MLKLPTLSYRWWRGDLIEVYKMLYGFYDKEIVDRSSREVSRKRTLPEGILTEIIKTYKAKCIWDKNSHCLK